MFINLKTKRLAVLILLATSLLQACASLDPDYEKPSVMMSSFRVIPAEGMLPSFEIGLRIINPNPAPLKLEGVVYSISLQGHELIKGVGKGYDPIEGYSEGNITLNASADVIQSIRFFAGLKKNQGDPFVYTFKAKLDVGGIYPSLKITETGSFNTSHN